MMVKYVFFQIFQKEGKLIKVSTAFGKVRSLPMADTHWSGAFKVFYMYYAYLPYFINNILQQFLYNLVYGAPYNLKISV